MDPKKIDAQKKLKGGPKRSAGCDTCRARHVKCDELKPECFACARSHRLCEWYGVPGRRPDRYLPVVLWRPKSPAQQQRLSALPGNQKQHHAYDFFRSKCAVNLAGSFDSSFWCRLVLQAVHEEPIIQHAVNALGALSETIQNPKADSLQRRTVHDDFALQEYNKAVGLLGRDHRLHGNRSYEIALMSCVLFITFECMQDNYEESRKHIWSGLSIFRTWQAENSTPTLPWTTNFSRYQRGIDSELVNLFSRLNIQALGFIDHNLSCAGILNQGIIGLDPSVPKCFQSLGEARDWLHNCLLLQNDVLVHLALTNRSLPAPLRAEIPQANHKPLSQWLSAFHSFKEANSIRIGHRDYQGAILLEIHFKLMSIAIKGRDCSESEFDAFHAEFSSIVSWSSLLIHNFKYSAIDERNPHFTFDMGVLQGLYFTAYRCRDPYLRRQALQLLSGTPRQECIWNSVMLSRIAERIILIEEGLENINHVRTSQSSDVVNRLNVVQATVSPVERKVLVEFLRTGSGSRQHEIITY